MFGVIGYLPGCSAPFRPTTGRSALPFSAHPRPSSAQPFARDADQIDELVEQQEVVRRHLSAHRVVALEVSVPRRFAASRESALARPPSSEYGNPCSKATAAWALSSAASQV